MSKNTAKTFPKQGSKFLKITPEHILTGYKNSKRLFATSVNKRLRTVAKNRSFNLKFEMMDKNIHIYCSSALSSESD